MSILNKISLSICLVLDKRIQEWFRIREEFQNIGISVLPYIVGDGKTLDNEVYSRIDIKEKPPIYPNSIYYPTWENNFAPYNAWLSHKEILKLFLKNSTPDQYLLMLEDDVQIEPDFHEILIKCEEDLCNSNPDMIYLGSYNHSNTWLPTANSHIMRCKGTGGWHAVMIKYHIADLLSHSIPTGPFDWMCRDIHNEYNCLAIYPSIVSQKSGFSFIENSELQKPDRYTR